MYLECFDEVKALTEILTAVPTVVEEPGRETAGAKKVYEYYAGLDYFKRYPDRAGLIATEDDITERHCAYAYVKGTGGRSDTVILIGHIDTVDIEDFGALKEYAFDPDALAEKFKGPDADPEVRADACSGEYMFGRGALDMKSGVAGQMVLIRYFSEHPEELNGNLIAFTACDEEANSTGMTAGLKFLKELKEMEGFNYIACINADCTTRFSENDQNRYIFLGTIGKLLPCFYVAGKEAHVGDPYQGLDPNMIVSELTRLIDMNPDLCDESLGVITAPPISLKQSDLKGGYTVQTAGESYSYYNFLTLSMSPEDVMDLFTEKAREAFENVVNVLDDDYRRYCDKTGIPYTPLPWKTRVYSWKEYAAYLTEVLGDGFKDHIDKFSKDLNESEPSLDMRVFSIRVVQEASRLDPDQSPRIIVFFGSSFYGHNKITGRNDREKVLLAAIDEAVDALKDRCPNPIETRMFFPYICDSSFLTLEYDNEEIAALGENMPSWKTKYFFDSDLIRSVDVPVVNIGPYGKDEHKKTERVLMRYSFETVPNLTYRTILGCLDRHDQNPV